jgi:hypothetical protein
MYDNEVTLKVEAFSNNITDGGLNAFFTGNIKYMKVNGLKAAGIRRHRRFKFSPNGMPTSVLCYRLFVCCCPSFLFHDIWSLSTFTDACSPRFVSATIERQHAAGSRCVVLQRNTEASARRMGALQSFG